ncbi:hypothetical protein GCM10009557_07260 [Virgisporangium ochraceum]|uniref:VWFA domain-containing protein n=2 Tax=Virgisporangium ochraceum TaxID=65505 RepID=A0A8J4A4R5_9ACTN|nr:hypothetical protein Voc01_094440 [Virgisporangium ochraceum]
MLSTLVLPVGPAAAGPAVPVAPRTPQAPSAPRGPDTPDDIEEVYRRLGVDDVGAAYVVLVDVSGSMRNNGLYERMRRSLVEFFAAMAPNDRVSLVAVGSDATMLWNGPVGRSPEAIQARLPAEPTDAHTDLGAGIAAAVQVLEQRPPGQVAGVILLTDGGHDPPPGSPFPFGAGYAWQELAERAGKLPRPLVSFAVQLYGYNGAAQLTTVFRDTTVVDTTQIDDLTRTLRRPKEAMRAAAARHRLARELDSGLRVEWPSRRVLGDGNNSLTVRLRSVGPVPFRVYGLAAKPGADHLRVVIPPGHIDVRPGESVQVPITVEWDAGPRSWHPWQRVRADLPLKVAPVVGSPWTSLLTRGGFDDPVLARPTEVVSPAEAQLGLPWLWLLGAVLAIAIVALSVLPAGPSPGGALVAIPSNGAMPGGSVPLQRYRSTFSGPELGLADAVTVTGPRRLRGAADRLSISYGGPTARCTGRCSANGAVDLDDVRFEWHR